MDHLRAGDLNRLVSLQQRAATQDTYGGQAGAWTEIKKIYVGIEPLTAAQVFFAQQQGTKISHAITARYEALFADPKINASYRIVYGARIFDIAGTMNQSEKDRVIVMSAIEGLAPG